MFQCWSKSVYIVTTVGLVLLQYFKNRVVYVSHNSFTTQLNILCAVKRI